MLDAVHSDNRTFLSSLLSARGVRVALLLFVVGRLLVSLWAGVVVALLPAPATADEALRPYLGAPVLHEGVAGLLLGPWQRFDTMHYLDIARDGYQMRNSVFPPLYPLAIRAGGAFVQAVTALPVDTANLIAALVIGNLALIVALALLYRLAARELGDGGAATKTLLYLLFFPTGFFLFAAYSESLFLLFAVAAVMLAREGRMEWAGVLGLLAALTRLTGWALVAPLAYEYARRRDFDWRRLDRGALAVALPLLGPLLFFAWRAAVGLPPVSQVYELYWRQSTSLPGADVVTAVTTLLTGSGPRAGELSLALDLATLLLLAVTTWLSFHRLGPVYGLYSLAMLFFMLLPTSEVKPLFSFSRYALAFFPTFMLLAQAGRNPWLNRLILYPSLVLYLFFSGQFFMWGWVG